jgi:methylase of polypeptide subunit release factors
MPRLPTALLRRAYAIDAHLPSLLGPCRDLRAAQNELRWLREHVDAVAKARRAKGHVLARSTLLKELVRQRARGKPLQYILGTEWFGHVEIRCRKGVLIPRCDTQPAERTCTGTDELEQAGHSSLHLAPCTPLTRCAQAAV